MREGATKGVVQPRAVMEKVLAQLDAMVVPQAQDSQYFAPIRRFPADFSAADRERLTAEYTRMLDATLLPAYRRLRDFVRDEYLRQSRSSVAWTALPDGQAWYAYYVQEHTTTNLTPEQILSPEQFADAEMINSLPTLEEIEPEPSMDAGPEIMFPETDASYDLPGDCEPPAANAGAVVAEPSAAAVEAPAAEPLLSPEQFADEEMINSLPTLEEIEPEPTMDMGPDITFPETDASYDLPDDCELPAASAGAALSEPGGPEADAAWSSPRAEAEKPGHHCSCRGMGRERSADANAERS